MRTIKTQTFELNFKISIINGRWIEENSIVEMEAG